MAINKRVVIDSIEILEFGEMNIRQATVIEENGVELARTFHRHVVVPEDDVTNEDARVQAVVGAVHTQEVIDKYKEKKDKDKDK